MKKVLIISNMFPPAGGVGVQRNLKYAKYLPQFGWQSFVLTIKSNYFFLQDNELLKDIPENTKIFRTSCLKPKQKDFSWVKFNTKAKLNRKNKKINILKSIIKFIEKELVIPDIWISWLPFALLTGNKIIKKNKIDVIFCSGPAFTSFLIGYILSKKSKLPLILDYRDGWTIDARRKISKFNFFKNTIDYNLEQIILNHATKIIFVSDQLSENYFKKFNFVKRKSTVILNGFDYEDFSTCNNHYRLQKRKRLIIAHVGNCDIPERKPLIILFLSIIENVLHQQNNLQDKLQITFVGVMPQNIKRQIKNSNLENIVQMKNFIPHNQAVEFMKNSDILLLLIEKSSLNKTLLSGKLFEYLGAKRPILAFGPKDGAAGRVIHETKTGIVIDYETEKKEEMIKKLSSFINQVLNNQFKIDSDKSLKKYKRKELTRQLSIVLNRSTVKN